MALTKVPSNLDATVSTTQAASDNSTNVATTAYVTTALANLVDSSPSSLNTLNELAAALGDDANYATTTTNAIATKLPLAGGTMTGNLIIDPSAAGAAVLGLERTGAANQWKIAQGHTATDYLEILEGSNVRLTIKNGGNVGIGTTSPDFPLEIAHATPEINLYDTSSSAHFRMTLDGVNTSIQNKGTSGVLTFTTTNSSASESERMRIDADGKVGIGTASPSASLQVGLNNDSATSADSLVHLLSSTAPSTVNGFSTLKLDYTAGHAPGTAGAQIMFNQGYHSGNTDYTQPVGTIRGWKTGASDQYGGGLQFLYQPDAGALGVTVGMSMTGGGRVGIGTTSPASGLHLTGGNNTASKLTLTNTAPSPDNTWSLHPIYNGQDLLIQEDGTTRVTFKEGGDLLVGGTTDRSRKFVVEGTGDLMALYSTNAGAGGAQLDLIHDSASYADGDSVGIVNFSTDDYQLGSIKTVATDSDKGRFHIGVRKSSSAYNHNAFQLTNAGDEIYADIYSPSGSNRGAGYFRFKTDGGSTEESVAQIYMEQGGGDGASRKCNMYFQVSDNGNPSTALTIHNNKNLQAATGMSFGSNTASNYILDAYEEGNFTPIFACAGGTAPSSQTGTGQYTRIGDVVYLTGQITWSGYGSGGSNMRIAIPFNVIGDARAGMSIGLNSGISYTSGHTLHLIPEINTDVIYLVSSPSDGSGHSHLNFSNCTNSGSKIFSFSGCFHTRD